MISALVGVEEIKVIDYNKNLNFRLQEGFCIREKPIVIEGQEYESTYVALEGEEVLGIITLWQNKLHIHSLYLDISIKSRDRVFELISILIDFVRRRFSMYTYMQYSTYSLEKIDNLKKLGFINYRNTYEPRVELSNVEFQKNEVEAIRKRYEVINMINIDKSSYRELLSLAKSTYEASHMNNPPKDIELEVWDKYVKEDLIEEGSFVLIRDNEVVAFALMHHGNNDEFELGWRGSKENIKETMKLLAYLQVEYALSQGKSYLNCEIDTTDIYAWELIEVFKVKEENPWMTFQLKI